MRKLFLLLSISLFVISCVNIQEPSVNMKIINLSALSTSWKGSTDANGLNRYYTCHFSMPEITSFVYTSGSVTAYIKKSDSQQILPFVQHLETATNRWTRTIDYEYSPGGIDLYVTNSDFAIDPPGAMDFRVVLTW